MEQDWLRVFTRWPSAVPRRGLAITTDRESIEFSGFMLSGNLVLLERDRPDSQGGRRVMLHLGQLAMVKILDPVEMPQFAGFGFQNPPGV